MAGRGDPLVSHGPQVSLEGGSYHKTVEWARKKANKELKRSLEEGLGLFVLHPELHADRPELYRKDEGHLSDQGLDIFLDDLQRGLLAALGC